MDINIKRHDNGVHTGHYEPGNATSYRAIAVPWHNAEYQQFLGSVSDGWLVVSCNTGRAYLFQEKGILLDEYIQEHLGGYRSDYPHFGDLIRTLIGRSGGKEGKK